MENSFSLFCHAFGPNLARGPINATHIDVLPVREDVLADSHRADEGNVPQTTFPRARFPNGIGEADFIHCNQK